MTELLGKIQVNIPFTMLYESYLDRFLENKLNPEIGIDAIALDNFSLSDFEAIAKQFHERDLRITLHAPFMDLSPGSMDPKIWDVTRNRFEQMLQLVPVFKPVTVVCHSGYDERRYWHIRELWIEKSLALWSWLGRAICDEGSVLVLENVYENHPDDMRVFFKTLVAQGVGFCLDTGHQEVFSQVPLKTWIKHLGPFIGQLHLHDNHGTQDEHLAMGQGVINFRMLFEYLAAIRQEPPVITLEPHTEEAFLPSLEYLEKIWPW